MEENADTELAKKVKKAGLLKKVRKAVEMAIQDHGPDHEKTITEISLGRALLQKEVGIDLAGVGDHEINNELKTRERLANMDVKNYKRRMSGKQKKESGRVLRELRTSH